MTKAFHKIMAGLDDARAYLEGARGGGFRPRVTRFVEPVSVRLVKRQALERCVRRKGAYHSSASAGQAYHTDPQCRSGTMIYENNLRCGRGSCRWMCADCASWQRPGQS